MNDRSPAWLLCPVLVAGFAAILYAAIRHRETTALLAEITTAVKDAATETHSIHFTLRQQPQNAPRIVLLPVPQGVSQATH